MSKSNKHLIIILLITCIFLVGCNADIQVSPNNTSNIEKLVAYEPMGKAIYSPVEIPYVIENPIEIINIDDSKSNNNRIYFQISGLVDKDVENKINESIKTLYEEMIPYATGEKIPPYRGLKSIVEPGIKTNSTVVSITPSFNCNNVLSVNAYVGRNYYKSIHEQTYYSMSESLNIDLNTGKEFFIQDVLTNDVNGLEIINEAILKELARRRLTSHIDYDEHASLALVAPFKGISSDQKFYLSYDGINLIIDHNNPEFNIGFNNERIIVPFDSIKDHTAITKRFYDESTSIFKEEANSKRFIRSYNVNSNHERSAFSKDNTDWYIYISYPKDLPQPVIDIMGIIKDWEQEKIIELSQGSPILYIEQNLHAYPIGPYVNISSNINFSSTTNTNGLLANNYVYLKTGEPILLEDLFIEGYDHNKIISNAIEKSLKEYGIKESPDIEVLLDDISFQINETEFSFITKPYEWDPGYKYPHYFSIPYKEIGYKNLKVFDN